MKIVANREELLSAARDAQLVAPDKSPLDVLECAYLATEDGKLTVAAGNLETSMERRIPVQIEKEGVTVIKANLLAEMLRHLTGDRVTIEQKDNRRVEITCDEAFYGFSTLDAATYPRLELPFPEDTVMVKGLPVMAKRTVFAAAEESDKPQMKCVHLIFDNNGLRAVSSDSFRIAAAKGDSKSAGAVDMLIPAASLEKAARLMGARDVQVGTTGKAVVFMREDMIFSARLVEGGYFDDAQMFSMAKTQFIVLSDAESLRRTMSSVYAVVGAQNRFNLSFSANKLRMTCESEYGTSSAETEVVPLSGVPSGIYWYNPLKLLECFKALTGTLRLEVAQNGALLMRTDELTCMQVCMREPKPIEKKAPKTAEKKAEKPEKKEKKAKESKAKGAAKRKKKEPAELSEAA